MSKINLNGSIGHFKENTEKFVSLQQVFHSSKEYLGEALWDRFFLFSQSFYHLSDQCTIIKMEGNSGAEIPFSEFFLNDRGSGYQYFKTLSKEADDVVVGLAYNIAELVEILSEIKEVQEYSNRVPPEREQQRISVIKVRLEICLEEAEKNLLSIVKILDPGFNLEGDKNILDLIAGLRRSPILTVIKNLDEKEVKISDRDKEIKKLTEVAGRSRAYETQLAEKEKLVAELAINLEQNKELTDALEKELHDKNAKNALKDISKKYHEVLTQLNKEVGFLSMLRSKILLLRFITYAIPIFVLMFHFCEFFAHRNNVPSFAAANCRPCSFFKPSEAITSNLNNELIGKKADQKQKEEDQPDYYLYFHLALITGFLLAFQQLRTAVKDLNIKKNLREIYRHRVLVAENSELLIEYFKQDEASKGIVIRSAVSSLFENEPSIFENKNNPVPPQVFDIKNMVGGG